MAGKSRRASQFQTLDPRQQLELRAYRMLGVLTFRRILLSWERFHHRRDGRTNENYHMRVPSPGGAAAFEGYLLYHNLLHTISLSILTAVLLGKACCALPWNIMDLLAVGMCVVNLWCLMLQRYNRLRLLDLRMRTQQSRARRLHRRAERLLAAPDETDPEAGKDLALVQALLACLSAGEIVFLGADDVPSLRRMAALLDAAEPERRSQTPPPEAPAVSQTADRLAEALAVRIQPYSRVERRADWIQRRLLPHEPPLISLCAVVTEDVAAEAAFSELFRQSAPEEIWETLNLLAAVLERLPAREVQVW